MYKLGILGVALLTGLGHLAVGDDPRNQISTADNKQVALPEATAAANPANRLAARSAFAIEAAPDGKSNVVEVTSRPLNLTAKRGLSSKKLESPKLLDNLIADPSKLANFKANESKPNTLAARDSKRIETKASHLQQVSPFKTGITANLRRLPALILSDNGGK